MRGARRFPHRQRKGPLKVVQKILRKPAGLYDQGLVLLECGHIVKSNSNRRARCDRCSYDPVESS